MKPFLCRAVSQLLALINNDFCLIAACGRDMNATWRDRLCVGEREQFDSGDTISALLQKIAEGPRSRPIKKRIQLHVATRAWGEVVAVNLPQRRDASSPVFVPDFTIAISAPVIKTGAAML